MNVKPLLAVRCIEALENFPRTDKHPGSPASIVVVSSGTVLRRISERLSARGKLDEVL
jgi:hypothetical protein